MKKEKLDADEKDEFDLMDKNQRSLTDQIGTSPDDIEKKLNAKRKGNIIYNSGIIISVISLYLTVQSIDGIYYY